MCWLCNFLGDGGLCYARQPVRLSPGPLCNFLSLMKPGPRRKWPFEMMWYIVLPHRGILTCNGAVHLKSSLPGKKTLKDSYFPLQSESRLGERRLNEPSSAKLCMADLKLDPFFKGNGPSPLLKNVALPQSKGVGWKDQEKESLILHV